MAYNGGFDGLVQYVDETSFELISKTVLGTNLATYVDVRAGLKGNVVDIPLVDETFNVGSGDACSWSANNTASISQVTMNIYHAKVQHEYCPQVLRDTFLAGKLAAGQFAGSESLPYEQVFAGQMVEKLQNWNEKFLIDGKGTSTGIRVQMSASYAADGDTYKDLISGSWTAATAVAQAHTMYELLDPEISTADDLILITSVGDYKKLALGVTQENYFHIAPDLKTLYVPGTNIKVVACAGIKDQTGGKNNRFLTRASNIILGTDLTGDFEQFKLWYSQDNDQMRATMKWAIGVSVKEPGLGIIANPTVTNYTL
jgi:hypothetical protein